MAKSLDTDQDQHLVSSGLGPSCLQRLSVYDTSMQRGLCSWRLLEKSFLSPDICRCRLLKWVSLSIFLAISRFIDIRVLGRQGICHFSGCLPFINVCRGFRDKGILLFFFMGCRIPIHFTSTDMPWLDSMLNILVTVRNKWGLYLPVASCQFITDTWWITSRDSVIPPPHTHTR